MNGGTVLVHCRTRGYPYRVWQQLGRKWLFVGWTYVETVSELRLKHGEKLWNCFAITKAEGKVGK